MTGDSSRFVIHPISGSVDRLQYSVQTQIDVGIADAQFIKKFDAISGIISSVSSEFPQGTAYTHASIFQEVAAHSTPFASGYSSTGVAQSGNGYILNNTTWANDTSSAVDRSTLFRYSTPGGSVATAYNTFST